MLDLVASEAAGSDIDVFMGQADGGLSGPTQYRLPCGAGPASIAIGDLNQDGIPDVVAGCGGPMAGGVQVFLNDGRGGLSNTSWYSTLSADGPAMMAIGIGDITGDGLPDIVTSWEVTSLLVNLGNGSFAQPVYFLDAGPAWGGLVVADFNGDSVADIAFCASIDYAGYVVVLLNQRDGGLSGTSYDAGCSGGILAVAGTGPPNLLVQVSAGFSVLFNSSDGTFNEGALHATSLGPFMSDADLNGDGIVDVTTSLPGGALSCPTQQYPTTWFVKDAGDAPGNGAVSVWFGIKDGTFSSPFTLTTPWSSPAGLAPLGMVGCPRALAVADACGGGITVFGNASRP